MIQLGIKIRAISADLLHYSAVASEPLESASKAPAAEVAVLVPQEGQRHWRVLDWSCGGKRGGLRKIVGGAGRLWAVAVAIGVA